MFFKSSFTVAVSIKTIERRWEISNNCAGGKIHVSGCPQKKQLIQVERRSHMFVFGVWKSSNVTGKITSAVTSRNICSESHINSMGIQWSMQNVWENGLRSYNGLLLVTDAALYMKTSSERYSVSHPKLTHVHDLQRVCDKISCVLSKTRLPIRKKNLCGRLHKIVIFENKVLTHHYPQLLQLDAGNLVGCHCVS